MATRRISRRSFITASVSAAASLVLPNERANAQAGVIEVARIYESAKKEGPLTYYCSHDPALTERALKVFKAQYPGVEVNLLRLSAVVLGKRFLTEAGAGNFVADVLQLPDPLVFEEATQKGWLANLDDLPAYVAFPQAFKTRTSALVRIDPHTISYNSRVVKEAEAPTMWTSLLEPKWKGQIMSADLRISLALMDWAYLMLQSYGPEYLRNFAGQNVRWVPSQIPGSQQVIAGEAKILVPNQKHNTFVLEERGAPIRHVVPEMNTGHESYMGVSARTANPNAARLLANFVMSPQGAEAFNSGLSISPLPNIPGALPMPSKYRRPNFRETLEHREEILNLVGLK